ncbi:MAG: hypothetical protein J0I30_08845 [Burkholderiales bacterium]|nr:hypothetical protein [Burkholderiales bacterium]
MVSGGAARFILTTLAVALVGCVTINVYFPAAAAQKAADQFIGNVLGEPANAPPPKPQQPQGDGMPAQPSAMLLDLLIPAAYAAQQPDLRLATLIFPSDRDAEEDPAPLLRELGVTAEQLDPLVQQAFTWAHSITQAAP